LKDEKLIDKITEIHLPVHDTLKKSHEKYKSPHNHHRIEKTFNVGDKSWLHLSKERLQGLEKKIKDLWYGHFLVLEKVGHNAYRLSMPSSYMCI
jgi:hypothetical protein